MSFTLIGKHEKDSRANRDGYVTAMEELMAADPKVCHIDCDLYNCINTAKLEKEKRLQEAMLAIRKKYDKNAILKGVNLEEGATMRERNNQIGGHKK